MSKFIKIKLIAVMILVTLSITFLTLSASAEEPKRGAMGQIAPPFTGVDFDGNKFDLEEYYLKKPILVNFFSVHCVSCLTAVNILEKYRAKNNVTDEVPFVYVSLDDWKHRKSRVPPVWKKIFSKNQIRINDGDRVIGTIFDVGTLPVTVIIDTDGKVTYRRDDYNLDFSKEIAKTLDSILKK